MKTRLNTKLKELFGKKSIGILSVILLIGIIGIPAWSVIDDYVGFYYGSFGGGNNGRWIARVESTGEVGMLIWSTDNDEMDADSVITVDGNNGNFNGITDDGTSITGDIDDVTSGVTGTWSNSGVTGTLSGTGFDPSSVSPYVGCYSGTFTGDDTGTWSIRVHSNASVTSTVSPDSGGNYAFGGGIDPAGRVFLMDQSSGDVGIFGQISGSGVTGVPVTGMWKDKSNSDEGPITGNSVDCPSGTGDGGGGGGGCFISTMIR